MFLFPIVTSSGEWYLARWKRVYIQSRDINSDFFILKNSESESSGTFYWVEVTEVEFQAFCVNDIWNEDRLKSWDFRVPQNYPTVATPVQDRGLASLFESLARACFESFDSGDDTASLPKAKVTKASIRSDEEPWEFLQR